MNRRDKLYTVNKWNRKPANLFNGGGLVAPALPANYTPIVGGGNLFNQYGFKSAVPKPGDIKINSPRMTNSDGKNGYEGESTGDAVFSALGTLVAPVLASGISDGYSTGGVDEGISGVGNAVGSALDPVTGTVVKLGSAVVGGLVNRAFGTKENQENINTIQQSTANKRNVGSAMGQASTTSDIINLAGQMSGTSGFGTTDLVKGGWFSKGKARRKGQEYLDRENAAFAYQNYGLMTGAENVDNIQDNMVMKNYTAFGGPLEMGLLGNIGDGGAIEYDFMSDYLNTRKKQADSKGSNMQNLFAGMPNNLFALGGVSQMHGGDFGTGLTRIDAGRSHEENPYEGVQVGVDTEGVPNLVEEGETIFNDYVYSSRIFCDEETKKKFHIGKKRNITYADLSKKLEKEAAERPNDPISKAALKAQMAQLAEHQERQKAEMEAQRAREAFESLSDEEKVAVMQQASAEAQMAEEAQQAALQEQANLAAEQQGTVIPEGAAMMEGIPAEAPVGQMTTEPGRMQEPVMAAEGGKINKFDEGGTKRNVGTWKNDKDNHWDLYTKPGFEAYIDNAIARYNMAPDDAVRREIQDEVMQAVNGLQQSYNDYIAPNLGASAYSFRPEVKAHQTTFENLGGNRGFWPVGEDGSISNVIGNAIDLPLGYYTGDNPAGRGIDGYEGPQTALRHFGSTADGDNTYFAPLVDKIRSGLNLSYSPNSSWSYGDDGKYQLYGLSRIESGAGNGASGNAPAGEQPGWNKYSQPAGTPATDGNGQAGAPGSPAAGNQAGAAGTGTADNELEVIPKHRAEWLRYAGLFGPAVGLGMQALGIGRPDTSGIDAAAERAGNVYLADYKPIGNYLAYRPMDIWAQQNRLNANSRATERAIRNSGSSQGAKMAGLLASGYNDQVASGELYQKSLEYNDAKRQQVAGFNKDTDKFNADAYNTTSRFNTDALNRNNQYRAQLGMQAAAQKMDADAGWYNSLYGNIAGLFKGIGDLGRENYQHNRVADMVASRLFGTITDKQPIANGYITTRYKKKRKGGKI